MAICHIHLGTVSPFESNSWPRIFNRKTFSMLFLHNFKHNAAADLHNEYNNQMMRIKKLVVYFVHILTLDRFMLHLYVTHKNQSLKYLGKSHTFHFFVLLSTNMIRVATLRSRRKLPGFFLGLKI